MEKNIIWVEKDNKVIKNTKISSGVYELIDANTVLYYDVDLPIEIEERFDNTDKIIIRIITEKDDSGEKDIKFSANAKENTVEYRCINFDNAFGTGTKQPIEIGEVNGKKMYIHFWLYLMGEQGGSRKIEYSIWKEK